MGEISIANMTTKIEVGEVDLDLRNEKINSSLEDIIDRNIFKSNDDKKLTLEYIKNLEAKIHAISTVAKDPIIMMDNDGLVSFWNSAAEEMFGYNSDEIINKDLHDIIVPERFRPASKRGFLMFKESGKGNAIGKTIELAAIRKNGEEFPIELSLSAFKVDNEWHAMGIVRDITEKVKHTNILIEEKKKFLDSFNNAPVGIYRTSPQGEVLYANTFFLHMLGFRSLKELQRTHSVESIYADPAERHIYKKILRDEGVIYDFEFKLLKKDGAEIQALGSSRIVKDEADNELYYEGIITDITSIKEKEKSNKKLLRAIEQSNASIVITDSDGIIEYVNPKFEENTGYSKTEAIGLNPRVLKSGEQNIEFYKNLWSRIKSGLIWTGEFHNKKKNGELYWESATISPVEDEEGNIVNFVAVKEDITQKKVMISNLIEAKERAEESNKLKSEFLSQLSHEIRTPLNVILGYLEMINDELGVNVPLEITNNIKVINQESLRLTRTFDSIINYSEICSSKYQVNFVKCDLIRDILSDISYNYQDAAKSKKLDFVITSNESNISVICDKYSTIQMLSYLVDNAIKFTEFGSVEILVKKIKNEIFLQIKDTGIGISEDYLQKIFSPFSQEQQGYSRDFDGNGLGLALAKKYCDINNIDISITSKKYTGTTVELKFTNNHKI